MPIRRRNAPGGPKKPSRGKRSSRRAPHVRSTVQLLREWTKKHNTWPIPHSGHIISIALFPNPKRGGKGRIHINKKFVPGSIVEVAGEIASFADLITMIPIGKAVRSHKIQQGLNDVADKLVEDIPRLGTGLHENSHVSKNKTYSVKWKIVEVANIPRILSLLGRLGHGKSGKIISYPAGIDNPDAQMILEFEKPRKRKE